MYRGKNVGFLTRLDQHDKLEGQPSLLRVQSLRNVKSLFQLPGRQIATGNIQAELRNETKNGP